MADQASAGPQSLDHLYTKPTKTFHKASYSRIDPTKSAFDGTGKTILITAGATGVGFAISKSFAKAGIKRIIILSRRAAPQEKAKRALEAEFPNTTVDCVQASVLDYPRITQVLRDAGDIDILIMSHAEAHNIAIPSKDLPLEELQTCFDTNVIAPMHLVQQYLQLPMPASGSKTVIHVSTASSHTDLPQQVGYGPSKTAFTRMLGSYLAEEHGPKLDNVRLFTFHPGMFLTEASAGLGMTEDTFVWEDIALAGDYAVWLASPEADFLHGRFTWAHWDVDEMLAQFPEKIAKSPKFLKTGLVV